MTSLYQQAQTKLQQCDYVTECLSTAVMQDSVYSIKKMSPNEDAVKVG
jgi:hypothetical protein